MQKSASRPSPAKLNLVLEVGPKLPSGRHLIRSIVVPLELSDSVEINIAGSDECWLELSEGLTAHLGDVRAKTIVSDLSSDENIAWKAVESFRKRAGIRDKIKLKVSKSIPIEAGLGGGSSNAATTLLILNELFGRPLPESELRIMAASLGSDVTAILVAGCVEIAGTGDVVTRQVLKPAFKDFDLIIVKPPIGVSTAEAYKSLGRVGLDQNVFPVSAKYKKAVSNLLLSANLPTLTLASPEVNSTPLTQVLEGDFKDFLSNDFEGILSECEWFSQGANALKSCGAQHTLLCGSGSSMCGFLSPAEGFQNGVLNGAVGYLSTDTLPTVLNGWWICRSKIDASAFI